MAAPVASTTRPLRAVRCGPPSAAAEPAPLRWARSGAMALCGHAGGAPRLGPAPLAARADALLARVRALAPAKAPLPADGAALLGERAAIGGLGRRGRIAPGGACRLLRTADGWIAVNLARPDDVSLLPAWLERDPDLREDPWTFLARELLDRCADTMVARGREMGLAVAEAASPARVSGPAPDPAAAGGAPTAPPFVVDLSALWAGPLCTHLLHRAGARVVKVEGTSRPDGARRGPSAFFDLLNAGKASVALDLASQRGRDRLRALVDRADVVVEASRPRALRQLGIEAEAWLAGRPGRVWTSITGHGRGEPEAGWVAFGDDAAVAAGWAVASGSARDPVFPGDAVADPLAGLEAAAGTLRAWASGGGLVDVSLAGAARAALGHGAVPEARTFADDTGTWQVECEGTRVRVAPPRARRPAGHARPLGADTEAVLREAGVRC